MIVAPVGIDRRMVWATGVKPIIARRGTEHGRISDPSITRQLVAT
ncbi:hypothetical protein [Nonomuraea sp. NPDC049480]